MNFNDRPVFDGVRRSRLDYQVQKLTGGEWTKMSEWGAIDEERLQRHARALGGSVRLVRRDAVVREWREGQEIHP